MHKSNAQIIQLIPPLFIMYLSSLFVPLFLLASVAAKGFKKGGGGGGGGDKKVPKDRPCGLEGAIDAK
jgi:hypothetical protein